MQFIEFATQGPIPLIAHRQIQGPVGETQILAIDGPASNTSLFIVAKTIPAFEQDVANQVWA